MGVDEDGIWVVGAVDVGTLVVGAAVVGVFVSSCVWLGNGDGTIVKNAVGEALGAWVNVGETVGA